MIHEEAKDGRIVADLNGPVAAVSAAVGNLVMVSSLYLLITLYYTTCTVEHVLYNMYSGTCTVEHVQWNMYSGTSPISRISKNF